MSERRRPAPDLAAVGANAEARNSAILRALPDLMFIFERDGTYVDYHARDDRLLFVRRGALTPAAQCS